MSKSSSSRRPCSGRSRRTYLWSPRFFGQLAENTETALARDLSVAQKPIYQLGLTQSASPISVEAWVDNPNLTYAVGQPLRVIVRPHQDAYVTIVDVGSSGRVAVLFPNHFQRETRVPARATLMIPSDRSEWQVKVNGPTGIDLIQVIASQKPLTLPELTALVGTNAEAPLITLGRSAEDFARDLVAQLKPPAAAGGTVEQSFAVRNLLVRVVDSAGTAPAVAAAPGAGGPLFAVLPPRPPAAFGLTISTDRPAYRVGEIVRILASSRNDCRLTLVSVGPSGNAVQLFPNASQRDNLIRAGQVVMVPSPNSPLQIVAHAPTGVEGIIATCREDLPSAAASIDAGASGFIGIGTIQTFGHDLIATGTAPPTPQVKIEQTSTSYIVVE